MGVVRIQISDNPALAVELKRSRRARRLSLRVSSVDARVTLTMPSHVSAQAAQAFVDEKSDWIASAVARCETPVFVRIGQTVPIGGQVFPIVAGSGRAAKLQVDRIEAPEGKEGPAVKALVKHMARARLAAAVDRFASALGREPGRLTLRDTRSRWGSCTSEGNLMFSWRLILAPADVLTYVAAHEVDHLQHMDHSLAFWRAVEDLYSDYREPRAWLRHNGAGLHRYKFQDEA